MWGIKIYGNKKAKRDTNVRRKAAIYISRLCVVNSVWNLSFFKFVRLAAPRTNGRFVHWAAARATSAWLLFRFRGWGTEVVYAIVQGGGVTIVRGSIIQVTGIHFFGLFVCWMSRRWIELEEKSRIDSRYSCFNEARGGGIKSCMPKPRVLNAYDSPIKPSRGWVWG